MSAGSVPVPRLIRSEQLFDKNGWEAYRFVRGMTVSIHGDP
jgi:hypothetical protein